jgi:hypothetical protein
MGIALVAGCHGKGEEHAWRAADDNGFFSPIPLPVADIDQDDCVEQVIDEGAGGSYAVNGEDLVDLGIFHIHAGIEHAGSGTACDECADPREGHIVLGTAACKAQVDGGTHATLEAWADAMLETCARSVVSFGVCLDGDDTSVTIDDLWNHVDDGARVCYNFGGPTGSHAGHPGMVQWIHALDACESIDPDLVTKDWQLCTVKESPTAPAEVPGVRGDIPLCGYVDEDGCEACGQEHQRCCDLNEPGDAWYFELIAELFPFLELEDVTGCNPTDGSTCTEGRCWPEVPHWELCGHEGQRCCGPADVEWQAAMPDSDGCDFFAGLSCVAGKCHLENICPGDDEECEPEPDPVPEPEPEPEPEPDPVPEPDPCTAVHEPGTPLPAHCADAPALPS